jgi:hypothetical protein
MASACPAPGGKGLNMVGIAVSSTFSREGGDGRGPVRIPRGRRRLGAGGSRRRECGGGEIEGEDHGIGGLAQLARLGDTSRRECGEGENTAEYRAVEAGSFFFFGQGAVGGQYSAIGSLFPSAVDRLRSPVAARSRKYARILYLKG